MLIPYIFSAMLLGVPMLAHCEEHEILTPLDWQVLVYETHPALFEWFDRDCTAQGQR